MDITNHVRTVFSAEGNLSKEVTKLNGKLLRTKTTMREWHNGSLRTIQRDTVNFKNKTGGLNNALNSTAMRFFGLAAATGIGIRAYQQGIEWVKKSIDAYREFSNSMAEVSTILSSNTMPMMTSLTEGVQRLSMAYGKSANDMSKAMYQILSAAVDAKQGLNLLNTATKAAIAGLTSVEHSVDILTSIINSYGKSVYEATNISDILFQTVVRGKLRYEDFTSAVGYGIPIAASAGIALKEFSAALATATRMGIHADMAVRGLALMMQNAISPTKAAHDAAMKFGVDMSAVGLRIFGLKGFLTDLSDATKKYGLSALPQLIRNMRSFRVAIALTSEVGLKGFTEDLYLMEHATGKTNEALSKMINTQQRQAAVLAQNMEYIERKIGEFWSPIDINIKATKLWFAAFLSGGFSIDNANKALSALTDTIKNNRDAMYTQIETARTLTKQPIFDQLFNMANYTSKAISQVVTSSLDISKVKEYLIAANRATKQYAPGINVYQGANQILQNAYDTMHYHGVVDKPLQPEIKSAQEQLDKLAKTFPELSNIKLDTSNAWEAAKQIKAAMGLIDDAVTSDVTTMQENQDIFTTFFAPLDTAREEVNKYKMNIIELGYAINNLKLEVQTPLKDLLGGEHAGSLGLKIDTSSFTTAMDRMKRFSTMITKYGNEWENKFKEVFADKTYTVNGEEISYIDEYNSKLKSSIDVVKEYTEAKKKANKVMSESNRLIAKNNIEIAGLELAGMIRRRGNTRSEIIKMKKLRIANAIERLKEQKAQYEAEAVITQDAYDEAKSQIAEYFDSQAFYLYMLKDTRDSDLENLSATMSQKLKLLERYETALQTQQGYLNRAYQIEQNYTSYLTTNLPELSKLYEDTYGVSFVKMMADAAKAMKEFNEENGKKTTPSLKQHAVDMLTNAQEQNAGNEHYIKTIEILKNRLTGNTKTNKEIIHTPVTDILNAAAHNKLFGGLEGFASGIDYVPHDMVAQIHQGERIIPAGKSVGDNINISINVNANVSNDYDVEKLGATLGATMQTQLADKTGRSKYRMR